MMHQYKIGKEPPQWSDEAQTITFIVTEDCNLRCKYCYITHKSSNKKMKFETAKKFIDYILTADIRFSDSVIIEFFGGEPMLEMQLVDRISDYFKIRAFELNHKWAWNYRFNFATNGVNYSSTEVQAYIKKNYGKVSIGISIDGIKEKHDLNRVFPDGSGSYSIIEKNIPLWISQFTPATKMTFASADLCYLKDSVIDLWNHGITDVSANVVFENVWQENDDKIFENQLKELADYIIDNDLYDKYYCTFFSDSIGGYLSPEERNMVYCGSGKMLAVGPEGKIYPCVRYKDYSLNNKPERIVGTVDEGINMELVRAFMVVAEKFQDDEECAQCPIASGCPQCLGFSYDEAESSTNFQRAKYNCKMQKARVRANEYFFSKLLNHKGIKREIAKETSMLYFLLDDNFVTFCHYNNYDKSTNTNNYMTLETIENGLKYSRQNFMSPVFIHGDKRYLNTNFSKIFDEYSIQHIVPIYLRSEAVYLQNVLYVIDHSTIKLCNEKLDNCIYNIYQYNIEELSNDIVYLLDYADRINVNVLDVDSNFNEKIYLDQLLEIKKYLVDLYMKQGIVKEINILTDILLGKEWSNCKAGERSFTYAPNGKFYVCPGFYFEDNETASNIIVKEFLKSRTSKLYRREFHPICQECDAKQCRICVYHNQKATGEVNVSPSYLCRKSHIERTVSLELGKDLLQAGYDLDLEFGYLDYKDPIFQVLNTTGARMGYYKFEK